jgi:hypothetical protein
MTLTLLALRSFSGATVESGFSGHRILDFDRAFCSTDDAAELDEGAVA